MRTTSNYEWSHKHVSVNQTSRDDAQSKASPPFFLTEPNIDPPGFMLTMRGSSQYAQGTITCISCTDSRRLVIQMS